MVTIRHVAESAKVSIGTVSRVLSGDPTVQPENAEKVRRAVHTLSYVPLRRRNGTAHEAGSLKGKTVALLLLGLDRSLSSLPSVADAIHGIEAATSEADANLLLADVPLADRLPPALERQRIDGVILKGALQGGWVESIPPALRERLRAVPSVWFLGRPHGGWGDVVQSNDLRVGQIAAEYLIAKGHKTLAFLNPKPDQRTFIQRQAGFVAHAELAGATVQKFLGEAGGWTLPLRSVREVEAVQGLVDALLASSPRPTAVFVPGDSVAAMVYRALYTRGMTVGRDLSIISCNNETPLLAGLYPQLTTIDIHANTIGRRAVDQLAWRMGHRDQPAMDVSLEPEILVGQSVAGMDRGAG
jgi:DNA-binding LacI/PurR family transcriptional regulator